MQRVQSAVQYYAAGIPNTVTINSQFQRSFLAQVYDMSAHVNLVAQVGISTCFLLVFWVGPSTRSLDTLRMPVGIWQCVRKISPPLLGKDPDCQRFGDFATYNLFFSFVLSFAS